MEPDIVVDYSVNLIKTTFDYYNKTITLHDVKNNSKLMRKLGKGTFFIVNESKNTYINGVYKTLDYKSIKRYFNNMELIGMSVFCNDNNTLYYIVRDHTCYNNDGILCLKENKKNSNKDKMEDNYPDRLGGLKKLLKISSSQKETLRIAQQEVSRLQQELGNNEDNLRRLGSNLENLEQKYNKMESDFTALHKQHESLILEKNELLQKVVMYQDVIKSFEDELNSVVDKVISNKVFNSFKINNFRLDEEMGRVCVMNDNSDDLWKQSNELFVIPYNTDYVIDINGKDSSNFIICLTSNGQNTRSNKSFKGKLTKGDSFYVEYVGSMKLPIDNYIEVSYQI